MLYDAFDGSIRVVKLRSRQANCQICGDSPTIAYLADYPLFCSSGYNDGPKTISIIPVEKRISVYDLKELIGNQITLIDVREQVEFDICSIPGSKCIPFRLFEAHLEYWQEICKSADPIYFICRRGNESQRAVVWVQEKFGVDAFDIVGGLTKWSEVVDITFPSY